MNQYVVRQHVRYVVVLMMLSLGSYIRLHMVNSRLLLLDGYHVSSTLVGGEGQEGLHFHSNDQL